MVDRKPSMTAAVVAASLLLLPDDPLLGPLVDRSALPYIERNVREVAALLGLALDHVPWSVLRRLAFGVERGLSPGFIAHYALRKHAVRAALLAAVGEGHHQVVLLGAGFDMLSMSVPADADIFEVDHPATQAAKQRAIANLPATRKVTFVGADLATEPLATVLTRTPGFDRHRKTVFVAEGLFMYLERRVVVDLLDDINDLEGARLIATLMTPDRNGRARLHSQRSVVDLCMRLLGEEFVWGASISGLEELLSASGLSVQSRLSSMEVARTIGGLPRSRLPRPTGEVLLVATALEQGAPRSHAQRGSVTPAQA